MIKPYTAFILASSFLLLSTMPHVYADENLPASNTRIQRSFVNLSFNEPKVTSSNNYQFIDIASIPGWKTTHRLNGTVIEMWKNTGPTGAVPRPPTGNQTGDYQYAELNANEPSAIYQNVCLFKDEAFDWAFTHAARSNLNEIAKFYIGKIDTPDSSTKPIPTLIQSIGTSAVPSALNKWTVVGGENVKVNDARVPKEGGIFSFIFEATNAGSLGNFIDDIYIKLKPAVEFSAASGSFYEGGNGTEGKDYSVPFNMVGQVLSTSDMPILQFKIEYPIGYTQTKAIYGVNYRLYKRTATGALVEINSSIDALNISNPNKVTFNYKPEYDSNLDYSKGVKIDKLVIRILGNTQSNNDLNLPFEFELDSNSKVIATSLTSCSSAIKNVKFDLKIQEDDIDLAVVKNLTAESVVQKDNVVSYTLEVTNKTNVQADGVVLRDTFKNLLRVSDGSAKQTALVCEDLTGSTSKSCSSTWTDSNALTALLNSTSGGGLNLGNIPANAKYRFTVKNLKVTDTDSEYAGFVLNTATIETTIMNDMDASNNISSVKTIMAAQSDLSNNILLTADNATGTGMFIIGKEGRTGTTPLWTQKTEGSKAYFPLKIQNSAALVQDYQLYASSSKVEPTLTSGDYSTLVKNTITPFTSGLKVEFYKVEAGQCKVGLTGQQITQLNIAANTVGQVCAVVTVSASITSTTNIWFAIESLQSGLGDIILDAVIAPPKLRSLELSNDQTAQVAVGGTYVFLHRLTNTGVDDEKLSQLNLVRPNDGFLYTLFLDKNKNDALDAGDTLLVTGTESELTNFILQPNQSMSVLIKVEAPLTATHGMSSQVKVVASANNDGKATVLSALSNTDSIIVSPNQLQILKSQFKVEKCDNDMSGIIIGAAYSLKNENLKPNQCLIYRIAVKNMGNSALNDVTINDMYPAYTEKWTWGEKLPMTSSGERVQMDGEKLKTVLSELLPQQEKSLYFGIRVK
ncbi:DUF11 domain-containing protein [Acinetobacter harbinensis]|uniref:DUF11 domain-containing protein n=1 Tax=Acinetobacter harbinensis TaxID=1353941 RepID=UPI001C4FDA81|nr:DUF11 domain-containing protein [Acinetobacter harbinensis]